MHTAKSMQRRGLTTLIALFWFFYVATRSPMTIPMFFGDKTVATFDLWSCQHLLSGIIFGALLRGRTSRPTLFLLIAAYGWEALEWSMESGWMGTTVAHWKAGHEHWSNRLLSDPLVAIIGMKLSLRFRWLIWVAVPGTIIWCLANLLAPDCMAVQQRILEFFTT